MRWPLWDEDCRKCHASFARARATRAGARRAFTSSPCTTSTLGVGCVECHPRTRRGGESPSAHFLHAASCARSAPAAIRNSHEEAEHASHSPGCSPSPRSRRAGRRLRLSGRHARLPDRRRAVLRRLSLVAQRGGARGHGRARRQGDRRAQASRGGALGPEGLREPDRDRSPRARRADPRARRGVDGDARRARPACSPARSSTCAST